MTTFVRLDNTDIVHDSLINNSSLIIAALPLIIGYYIKDTIFVDEISATIVDIPKFVENISFTSLLRIFLPYAIAALFIYVSHIMTTKVITQMRIDSVFKLISQLEKKSELLNVDELMIHIEKLLKAHNIYELIIMYFIPPVIIGFSLISHFMNVDKVVGIIVTLIFATLLLITSKIENINVSKNIVSEDQINNILNKARSILNNINANIANITNITNNNAQSEEKILINSITKNEKFDVNTNNMLQIISIIGLLFINYLAYLMYINKLI